MRPLRVLSLDGGGMRGVYAVSYLQRLIANFHPQQPIDDFDFGSKFDLIVGTSTGAIVAAALGCGVSLGDVGKLYRSFGPRIFKRRVPKSTIGACADLFFRKKALIVGDRNLRIALEETLGTETLGSVYKRRGIGLAIPAVEMSRHKGWVFKTPHNVSTTHRDDNYSLVDVCMATSAAPIYRSLASIDVPNSTDWNTFADGGLWANNPVMVALIEALELAEHDQEIQIFCLGTCAAPGGAQISKHDRHRGLREWKFGSEAASLSLDAQQHAYDFMASALAPHVTKVCSVVRFPSQPIAGSMLKYLALDETSDAAMNALSIQAQADADLVFGKNASLPTKTTNLIRDLFHIDKE